MAPVVVARVVVGRGHRPLFSVRRVSIDHAPDFPANAHGGAIACSPTAFRFMTSTSTTAHRGIPPLGVTPRPLHRQPTGGDVRRQTVERSCRACFADSSSSYHFPGGRT